MHKLHAVAGIALGATLSSALPAAADDDNSPSLGQTATPIKHVVVLFQENVSFDHYFGTYPHAQPNKDGTVYFDGVRRNTPRVNGLEAAGLLTRNPNGVNPFRIDRSVPVTCDQDHGYSDEQLFADGGLEDKYVSSGKNCNDKVLGPNSVMGYYDGNTVTALWNYAQHYAMSDNSFGTGFGPSTPGLLNLIAGTTFAGTITNGLSAAGNIAGGAGTGSVIGDPDPAGDICSNPGRTQITMSGRNVGDLLNAKGISWGAFMGGFRELKADGTVNCAATHNNVAGPSGSADYIPHHAFFQYWKSTANPAHLPPGSDASIGKSDAANHQYDLSLFYTALSENRLPAVSIVKAPAYQDGHAGYSDPLDEQAFLVHIVNAIMHSPAWQSTAIIISYDDSDGWYDHQMGPVVMQSNVADDRLLGPGNCGTPTAINGQVQNGRCGYGPRLPLLVISPYAKKNYVDHSLTSPPSCVSSKTTGTWDASATARWTPSPERSTACSTSAAGTPAPCCSTRAAGASSAAAAATTENCGAAPRNNGRGRRLAACSSTGVAAPQAPCRGSSP